MKFATFLAFRYFRESGKGFINFTAISSVVGTMLGTTALVITLSILNGFRSEVTTKLFDFQPHFRIEKSDFLITESKSVYEYLSATKATSFTSILERKSIIVTEKGETVVMVRAVENSLQQVMKFDENWSGGRFDLSEKDGMPGIVLGWRLADELGVSLGLDTIVTIVSPLEMQTGLEIPPSRKFILRGIFQSPMFDFDRNFVYISLEAGQRLFRKKGKISAVVGMCKSESDAKTISINDPVFSITTWRDMHADLFSAMQMEKWATTIVLALIIVVALFNLVSALVMLVIEKTAEIGILRTMGASRDNVRKVFLIRGLLSGIPGVVLGLLFGISLTISQEKFQWIKLPGDGLYLIDYIPVEIQWLDILLIAMITLLLTWAFSVFPASRAAKLDPVEAIYFE